MKTLKVLFLNELAEMHDAEQRLQRVLPKLAKSVTCPDLQKSLLTHMKESEVQAVKIEKTFRCLGEKVRVKKCRAVTGSLKDAEAIAAKNQHHKNIDAHLLPAIQKLAQQAITAYEGLVQKARSLQNEEAACLLGQILEQKKQAHEAVAYLAKWEASAPVPFREAESRRPRSWVFVRLNLAGLPCSMLG